MEGIHYLLNEEGQKVAVQIDLARYGALWEDFHDQLVAASRDHEESVPFETVKQKVANRDKNKARG